MRCNPIPADRTRFPERFYGSTDAVYFWSSFSGLLRAFDTDFGDVHSRFCGRSGASGRAIADADFRDIPGPGGPDDSVADGIQKPASGDACCVREPPDLNALFPVKSGPESNRAQQKAVPGTLKMSEMDDPWSKAMALADVQTTAIRCR